MQTKLIVVIHTETLTVLVTVKHRRRLHHQTTIKAIFRGHRKTTIISTRVFVPLRPRIKTHMTNLQETKQLMQMPLSSTSNNNRMSRHKSSTLMQTMQPITSNTMELKAQINKITTHKALNTTSNNSKHTTIKENNPKTVIKTHTRPTWINGSSTTSITVTKQPNSITKTSRLPCPSRTIRGTTVNRLLIRAIKTKVAMTFEQETVS